MPPTKVCGDRHLRHLTMPCLGALSAWPAYLVHHHACLPRQQQLWACFFAPSCMRLTHTACMLLVCLWPLRLSDGGLFTSSHKGGYKLVFDGGFSNLCPVPPVPHRRQAGHTHDSCDSAGVSTQPHAPAPAASLLLQQRVDSTKGITTKLLPSKPTRTTTSSSTSHSHSGSSGSSGSASYKRMLSAPEEHPCHSLQFSQRSSSIDHNSSTHRPQQHQHTVPGQRGMWLHPQRPGVWARRRHQQQTEQQLAASCQVEGPGAYVAAPGWFAIRVCVLPARHMHEFPTMFRVSGVQSCCSTALACAGKPWAVASHTRLWHGVTPAAGACC